MIVGGMTIMKNAYYIVEESLIKSIVISNSLLVFTVVAGQISTEP